MHDARVRRRAAVVPERRGGGGAVAAAGTSDRCPQGRSLRQDDVVRPVEVDDARVLRHGCEAVGRPPGIRRGSAELDARDAARAQIWGLTRLTLTPRSTRVFLWYERCF